MMNEVMIDCYPEKDTITKEVQDADTQKRFKEIEKIILPFLYNLQKTDGIYIHWILIEVQSLNSNRKVVKTNKRII